MSDGWYGPAIDNRARDTGGEFVGPVTIGVLHTTESEPGSFRPRGDSYFGHQSYPHFTVDVQNRVFRCWQHISLRQAARALANPAGGVQTNREGAIQIEVVGRAVDPHWDPILVSGLRELMRWIESETQIPRSSSVKFLPYPLSYGNRQGQRFSSAAWTSYAGWCGHQHVPENLHGDPGAIVISELLVIPVTHKEDPVSPEDKDEIVARVTAALKPSIDHLAVEQDMQRRDMRDLVNGGINPLLVAAGSEPLVVSAKHGLDGVIEQ